MMWLAYAMAWVSTAIAVSVGIHITGSAWCLWALLLPTFINVKSSGKEEKSNEEAEKHSNRDCGE